MSGLPRWLSGWRTHVQCRRCWFNPWVGTIPWGRAWPPTSVLLLGELHGQGSLEGYSPGLEQSNVTEATVHSCMLLNGNLRLQMSSAVFIHVWAAGECKERDSPWLQAAYPAHTKKFWTAPSCLRCPSGKRAERIIFFKINWLIELKFWMGGMLRIIMWCFLHWQ